MCDTKVLLRSLAAGCLGALVCSGTAWAQQMSSPDLVLVQETKEVTLVPNDAQGISVTCPEGTKLLSGGGGSDAFAANHFAMGWSMPMPGQSAGPSQNDGWAVGIVNRSSEPRKGVISAFALCSKTK